MAWQHWSGRDVATFVETVCGLPQYGAAMAQINGGTLQELYSKGMLQKGLTRAGVRDADHQTLIANAVSDLEYWTPEEVTSWYRENCTKPPPIPMAPSAPKPLRMAPRQKFYAKITGPMTPRQKTSTELGLQRSSKVPGHFSEERFTPIIYEKTYDFPSRGYGDVKLQELEEEVVVPPLKLRKSLARSVLDYESMRDSDSPPPGVVVKGLRGLQSLKEEEENAATKIQANFRQKQAKKEVAKKQQEKQEESAAAAKIQARYRGKKAGKEVQEMREQKGAATAIQARYRQRAAQREVDARRKEKQETEQAATRIQSRFRQRQATGEVEAMRHRRQEAEKNRRREEFKKSFAVKIDISKDPGSSQASVTIMVVPREAVDIPMNEETAQAATKIQARFRQKQAASEVDALRKRNDGQSAAVNDPADEIPDNEETALAATKIQARFRQKQAASEVAAMRQGNDGQSGPANDPADEIPDNEETALAATKIQAKFRQKQAASEVAAMRQGNDGQSGPANDPADEIPDNEETALAATKIQAKFRQKQAASEVAAMRQGNDGQSGPANDPADEIPDNEETALAATKIQAKFRQKQAASEVAAMRQGNDGQSGPANDPADEIPENEETALAATKIQAKFRQKQAASEVEAMKKEKEETAQAATKIQAKFRQKQAKNEVEAMRASAPAADPPVAEAVEAVEAVEAADDEIKAEDMKTTSEFGEVEAILAKKQKEQQDLVGDKSPKVEGMVPAAVKKRPMSVSPIIMEGDEEEEEE